MSMATAGDAAPRLHEGFYHRIRRIALSLAARVSRGRPFPQGKQGGSDKRDADCGCPGHRRGCRDDPHTSEEHTAEIQSLRHLVLRLLLGKKPQSSRAFKGFLPATLGIVGAVVIDRK